MPRRRFPLRLHHSDTLLMLLAVLTATAFCWVVLTFVKGPAAAPIAYSIEAAELQLPPKAARKILRDTLSADTRSTVSIVSSSDGVSIGVTPLTDVVADHFAAGQLAEQLADHLRDTDWSAVRQAAENELAEQLYEIDVRIRDASADSRRAGNRGERERLAASVKVSRLLRKRAELLKSVEKPASDDASAFVGEVAIVQHYQPSAVDVQKPLAIATFALLAATAIVRYRIGRPSCDPYARLRLGYATQAVRLPSGLELEAAVSEARAA